MNPHQVTRDFEQALCDYTGAPYCVALDNQSNALFLTLLYQNIQGKEITIPSHTYPSVPCEIIHAGGIPKFKPSSPTLTGAYQLEGSQTWDSALRLTHNMYLPGSFMCLSFTGAYKHLKLGKGGAILTDNEKAYHWFCMKSFSGRLRMDYHIDPLVEIGWNMYMANDVAARGLLQLAAFYYNDKPIENKDISLPYPDLSTKPAYK